MKKITGLPWMALLAQMLDASELDKASSPQAIEQLSPATFVGKTGRPLGSLSSIKGLVTKVGADWVELRVGVDKVQHFTCWLYAQPHPPKLPTLGATVRLTGFESLVQIGHDPAVGQYLGIRKEVLEAAGAEKSDPSGGPGSLRFDTRYWILEVTPVAEPPLKTGDGKFDLKIPPFPPR
jgi:hypothetical protein